MERVVVTGGAGFIGSHLVRALTMAGFDELIVIDRMAHGSYEGLIDFGGELVVRDVAKPGFATVLAEIRPSIVVHLAGITSTLELNAERLMRANVEGFRQVLEGARTVQARVLYASSAAVYGNGAIPMVETAVRRPHNLYGFSKLVMENLAAKYQAAFGLSALGIRYFNVYGPGERHKGKAASMISQLVDCAMEGRTIRLFAPGDQVRDFVHVEDAMSGTLAAVLSDKRGVINIGTGTCHSFNDLVRLVRESGLRVNLEYIDLPEWNYQARTLAAIGRATEALGYLPRVGLAQGIRDLVRSRTKLPVGPNASES